MILFQVNILSQNLISVNSNVSIPELVSFQSILPFFLQSFFLFIKFVCQICTKYLRNGAVLI